MKKNDHDKILDSWEELERAKKRADRALNWAIVVTLVVMAVVGFVFL